MIGAGSGEDWGGKVVSCLHAVGQSIVRVYQWWCWQLQDQHHYCYGASMKWGCFGLCAAAVAGAGFPGPRWEEYTSQWQYMQVYVGVVAIGFCQTKATAMQHSIARQWLRFVCHRAYVSNVRSFIWLCVVEEVTAMLAVQLQVCPWVCYACLVGLSGWPVCGLAWACLMD